MAAAAAAAAVAALPSSKLLTPLLLLLPLPPAPAACAAVVAIATVAAVAVVAVVVPCCWTAVAAPLPPHKPSRSFSVIGSAKRREKANKLSINQKGQTTIQTMNANINFGF